MKVPWAHRRSFSLSLFSFSSSLALPVNHGLSGCLEGPKKTVTTEGNQRGYFAWGRKM